jgi:urease accessory protein
VRAPRSSATTGTCTRPRRERLTTCTEIAVEVGRVTSLRRSARLAPRILATGATVRAALVPVQAGPLDGDHDRVRLHVGAGATLEIVPIAATLALPGRSRLELDATVEGALILNDAPLIVAEGADVTRRVRIEIAQGAVATVREIVVLGRAGEAPGRLDSTLRATLDHEPLLHDALRIEPAAADDFVALPPGHRVIGMTALLGRPGEPALAGPGALRRATGPDLPTVERALQSFSIGTLTRLPHSVHEPS